MNLWNLRSLFTVIAHLLKATKPKEEGRLHLPTKTAVISDTLNSRITGWLEHRGAWYFLKRKVRLEIQHPNHYPLLKTDDKSEELIFFFLKHTFYFSNI